MKIKTIIIVLAICSFAFLFRFLYQKQFGAVGYFILAVAAGFLALREWKKTK